MSVGSPRSRLPPTPRRHRHDAALFAVVLAAASLADYIAGGEALGLRGLISAAGLGLALGAPAGALSGALLKVAARLRRLSVLLWVAAGAGTAAYVTVALGAPARLGSRDNDLAMIAIAGSAALGAALVAAGLAAQPRPGRPLGWLGGLRPRARVPVCVALIALAAVFTWMDRSLEVDGYPTAHYALRWAAVAALFLALRSIPGAPPKGPLSAAAPLPVKVSMLIAGGALAVSPAIALRPQHHHEIRALLDCAYPGLALRLLRHLGDPDLDGYSAILGGSDCNSLRASVNPIAREIPGNGIDDNCRLGDAPPPPPAPPPAPLSFPDRPPPQSIALITVDTVVAARMSMFGAERKTTPELDRLAFGGALFERAYTTGGWTSLTIHSMLRGCYPRELRWTRVFETRQMRLIRAGEVGDQPIRLMFGLPLDDSRPTLPALLKRRGLRTAAVLDDGQSEFLDPKLGTALDFDDLVDMDDVPRGGGDDALTTDAALRVLEGMPEDQPFFLWVHYFGPHSPNHVRPGVERFGDSQEDGYDHELAYMDRHVARLLLALRKRNTADHPLSVLLTSDHGELFRKRNRTHGSDLREQLIRVPMVLWAPGLPRGRYQGLVSILDIMPTLLALTETPSPPGLQGIDIRRVIAGDPDVKRRILLSETWRFTASGRLDRNVVAAFDGERKLMWNLLDESLSLRAQEPGGRDGEELIGEASPAELRERLEAYLEQHGAIDLND